MMVTRGQQLGWIIGNEDRRIVAQIPQSSGPAVRSGITGVSVMVVASDVREIDGVLVEQEPGAFRVGEP